MLVCRSLATLALLLLLPAGPLAAQEEGAPENPPPAGEVAEQQTPEAQGEPTAGDSSDGDDSQEPAESPAAEAETPKPADADSPTPSDSPDEEPADEPTDGEADGAETEGEDKPGDEAQSEPEPNKAPEPRRLTGLGSVENPSLPGQPWRVHDLFRPLPPVVAPADVDVTVPPPGDAVVLFDGTDLSLWGHRDREDPNVFIEPQWKVENGYFQVTSGQGDLYTLDSFGSVQLHLEWAAPEEVRGRSQGRGNSGVKFLGLYEVQILDSYNNRTYADGHAAAIYGQYPPEVNVSRPPGKWQSYDIIFEIPQFAGDELVSPGYVTVLHNGVLVHHRRELAGVTGMRSPGEYQPHPPAGPIMLQDHGNPIRFRNVWVRAID